MEWSHGYDGVSRAISRFARDRSQILHVGRYHIYGDRGIIRIVRLVFCAPVDLRVIFRNYLRESRASDNLTTPLWIEEVSTEGESWISRIFFGVKHLYAYREVGHKNWLRE